VTTEASDVAFSMLVTSMPYAGSACRTASGSTMRRIVAQRPILPTIAASTAPRGTARSPPRRISAV